MQIIDANIILRYLLKDNPVLFNKAAGIIEGNKEIFIPNEVVAETVYVFEKVYQVKRPEIKKAWLLLINYPNLKFVNKQVLISALEVYASVKIDFVDSLIIGYNRIENMHVETFDKKLKKLLTH
jgi:predicted nucleic-acid-binding protein